MAERCKWVQIGKRWTQTHEWEEFFEDDKYLDLRCRKCHDRMTYRKKGFIVKRQEPGYTVTVRRFNNRPEAVREAVRLTAAEMPRVYWAEEELV